MLIDPSNELIHNFSFQKMANFNESSAKNVNSKEQNDTLSLFINIF